MHNVKLNFTLCNMSQQFSVKWNDFHTHMSESFVKLKNTGDFVDVTLISDDHSQVKAHKVVLAASSDYFKELLQKNKDTKPNLCLVSINSEELANIITYIYTGQIQLELRDLNRFLSIANQLKLEGLINNEENVPKNSNQVKVKKITKQENILINIEDSNIKSEDRSYLNNSDDINMDIDDDPENVIDKKSTNSQLYQVKKKPEVDENMKEKQKSEADDNKKVNQAKDTKVESKAGKIDDVQRSPNIRENSNKTVYDDEVATIVEHTNFTRRETPMFNIYKCNECGIEEDSLYSAKMHFEAKHQNVDKPREIIQEMLDFKKNLKKKLKDPSLIQNKQYLHQVSSEMKNRIAILDGLNDLDLNSTLRTHQKNLKQWMEGRIYLFYNLTDLNQK